MAGSDLVQEQKTSLYDKLSFPFPLRFLQTKRKGGQAIDFVPYTYYVARLNEVAPFGWSCDVPKIEVVSDRLLITVAVTIRGRTYTGTGVASADKGKDEWGGAHAEAFSQGFRRACMQFGMGLYLYHDGDVIESTFPDDFHPDEEGGDGGADGERNAGSDDGPADTGDAGGHTGDGPTGDDGMGGPEAGDPTEAQKERLRDLKATGIFHDEELEEWRESMRSTWTKPNVGRIIREMKDLYEDRAGKAYEPS